MNRPGDKFSSVERVGYHVLPKSAMEKRNKSIISLYTTCHSCRQIADMFDMSYEGVRVILRKQGLMGKKK